MSLTTDGMNITQYIENNRQEYMLMRYKTADNLSDEKYGEMFCNLQSEGILVNEHYDDVEWVLKGNDGRKFHVRFDMEENALWNNRLKHFALLKLDVEKADIHSTSVNIKRIKTELQETDFLNADLLPTYREQIGSYDRSRRMYLSALGEFLSFIDAAGAREYFEAVISVPQISAQKSRDLPCYQSILLFDYIINDFIQRTNTQERARYYPVLIWWKISSVIPLRPGEVYQLPKDCIHEKNGKYYIHIEG